VGHLGRRKASARRGRRICRTQKRQTLPLDPEPEGRGDEEGEGGGGTHDIFGEQLVDLVQFLGAVDFVNSVQDVHNLLPSHPTVRSIEEGEGPCISQERPGHLPSSAASGVSRVGDSFPSHGSLTRRHISLQLQLQPPLFASPSPSSPLLFACSISPSRSSPLLLSSLSPTSLSISQQQQRYDLPGAASRLPSCGAGYTSARRLVEHSPHGTPEDHLRETDRQVVGGGPLP
jgi:hypothetical protein